MKIGKRLLSLSLAAALLASCGTQEIPRDPNTVIQFTPKVGRDKK